MQFIAFWSSVSYAQHFVGSRRLCKFLIGQMHHKLFIFRIFFLLAGLASAPLFRCVNYGTHMGNDFCGTAVETKPKIPTKIIIYSKWNRRHFKYIVRSERHYYIVAGREMSCVNLHSLWNIKCTRTQCSRCMLWAFIWKLRTWAKRMKRMLKHKKPNLTKEAKHTGVCTFFTL